MGKKLDLIGKTFGKLNVISEAPKRENEAHSYWRCLCECGNVTEVRGYHLKNLEAKSCGCSKHLRGIKHHHWSGYESLPGTYYCEIKKRARYSKIPIKISIRDLWEQFSKQNKTCALSGLPLKFNTDRKSPDGNASLDRIDSSKGYTVDNIQWVHKDINRMKSDLDEVRFIELCGIIVEHKKSS